MDMQHGQVSQTGNMGTHGYEAWTCRTDTQREHAAKMQHKHAEWTCSKDKQRGHAAEKMQQKFSINMRMDMQH
jgi:hypothetical protein